MAIYVYNVWGFCYAFNHFVTFLVNTYEGLRNAYTCFGNGLAWLGEDVVLHLVPCSCSLWVYTLQTVTPNTMHPFWNGTSYAIKQLKPACKHYNYSCTTIWYFVYWLSDWQNLRTNTNVINQYSTPQRKDGINHLFSSSMNALWAGAITVQNVDTILAFWKSMNL